MACPCSLLDSGALPVSDTDGRAGSVELSTSEGDRPETRTNAPHAVCLLGVTSHHSCSSEQKGTGHVEGQERGVCERAADGGHRQWDT